MWEPPLQRGLLYKQGGASPSPTFLILIFRQRNKLFYALFSPFGLKKQVGQGAPQSEF